MEGDILVLEEHHHRAAAQIVKLIKDEILNKNGKYMISVAGESGSGKSETAAAIAQELEKYEIKSYIFAQDDYFVHPPHTNALTRKKDIGWVGTNEVKIDLLDNHLNQIKTGNYTITKPLVIFKDDRITEETVDVSDSKVIIVEGTFTTLLKNVDLHIFIDRNRKDTHEARLKRSREKQDEFLEKILTIEHNIIAAHKPLADLVITKDYQVTESK